MLPPALATVLPFGRCPGYRVAWLPGRPGYRVALRLAGVAPLPPLPWLPRCPSPRAWPVSPWLPRCPALATASEGLAADQPPTGSSPEGLQGLPACLAGVAVERPLPAGFTGSPGWRCRFARCPGPGWRRPGLATAKRCRVYRRAWLALPLSALCLAGVAGSGRRPDIEKNSTISGIAQPFGLSLALGYSLPKRNAPTWNTSH